MTGLPFRHRLICFLSVAAPAFSIFLIGRLVTNANAMVGPHSAAQADGLPLPAFTRGFLALLAFLQAHHFPLSRLGDLAAIAVACLGFVIVQRFPPDRAQRGILILVLVAWTVQVATLMAALVALASPFAPR